MPRPVSFGPFTLDFEARQLLRGQARQPVHLSLKAYELVRVLVDTRPRAIAKSELHDRLWPSTFVSEATLASLVAELRNALGERGREPGSIRTVHGFGYAFSGPAREIEGPDPARVANWIICADEITGGLETRQTCPEATVPEDDPQHHPTRSLAPLRSGRRLVSVIALTFVCAVVVVAAVMTATNVWRRTLRTVSPQPDAVAVSTPTAGIRAHASEAYRQGRYQLNRRNGDGLKKAVELFSQAVALDPASAPAYAALADTYSVLGMAAAPDTETGPKAKAAAAKALEIDSKLADAHTSLAAIQILYDWDWASADREFVRALELNPNYALGHYWQGAFYFAPRGRSVEAIAAIGRAHELDPLAPYIIAGMGQAYYFARQYDHAINHAHAALRLDPTFEPAISLLQYSYREEGMFTEAMAVLASSVKSADPLTGGSVERTLGTSGYRGFLRSLPARENRKLRGIMSRRTGWRTITPPRAIGIWPWPGSRRPTPSDIRP